MIKIDSTDQVIQSVDEIRNLKMGYTTNLYYDPVKFQSWIREGILFSMKVDQSVFFFRKNDSFYNIYFCAADNESFEKSLSKIKDWLLFETCVFEIISAGDAGAGVIHDILYRNGFLLYIRLLRMSRILSEKEEFQPETRIRPAQHEDIDEIVRIIGRYFDKYAEQLPLPYEFQQWIDDRHLMLYVENGKIAGFVIFDITGKTSHLRYWFVHPDFRGKKIGSSLLRRFFYECRDTRRQIFWVIENNNNAIIRYQHYGFSQESLVDSIYINNNLKYENRYSEYSTGGKTRI